MKYSINDKDSLNDFNAMLSEDNVKQVGVLNTFEGIEIILDSGDSFLVKPSLFNDITNLTPKYDKILYGKNGLENVVAAECDDDHFTLFFEKDGQVTQKIIKNKLWVAASQNYNDDFQTLNGFKEYKYIKYYDTVDKWSEVCKQRFRFDLYNSYCPVESNFISQGITMFKGMELKDVSILSFDIETDGLVKNDKSEVYLISNTFRRGGVIEKKLFDFKEYNSTKEMLEDWCKWVRQKDPSIMLGHNIYSYDLPYLAHVAGLNDTNLDLGRDGSKLRFNTYISKFRKDGSQFYEYFKCNVWGRQLIDTQFLALKYDVARNYESYGLKQIIKQEGLEKQGRVFVDASQIRKYKDDPEMWEKIKQYASDDAEDSLVLFDKMAPSFFYLTQMVPKTFQEIINGASGSQLNSILVRSYIQDGHSIPKASQTKHFGGGISHGVPGIYRNVFKVDVSSLYPSIIRQYKLYSKIKDPNGYFLYMAETLTKERLKNKALGKNSKYHYDLEQSQKIIINSLYGLTNAPGLNFNDPKIGDFVTEKGRDIIDSACIWATCKDSAGWGWKGLAEEDESEE